ncbi:MAG: ATP-binding protein [Candidatus Diapherotrites archaeon]
MDFDTIIREQREELERIGKQEILVPREKLGDAERALKFPNILAVLGVRRCGKSIFSYLLAKGGAFGYVNFDDERLLGAKAEDLNLILESFYRLYGDVEFVVLDEAQNVRGWELFANRLRRTKKVILTGSNSNLLSGELATHLTGRHSDAVLFPFSFREFIKLKKFGESAAYTTKEKAMLLRLLEEYLRDGGFPEVQKFGGRTASLIYEDILAKDILLRHKIKKIEEMRKLARYLVTNSAKEFSYAKTAKLLSIKHVATMSKWTGYLEEAFLVFRVERFDFKLKRQFLAPKKIYCIDTGMMGAAGFRVSENRGVLIENAVAVELRRRAQWNEEIYYWKDYQHSEVDFVVKAGEKIRQLIQASYANSREDIREREPNALIKASRALRCRDLLIITWGYEGTIAAKGHRIKCTPLWKWLLAGR